MLDLGRGREVYHSSGRKVHFRGTNVVVGKHEKSLLIASVFPGKQVARSSDENMKEEEVLEV